MNIIISVTNYKDDTKISSLRWKYLSLYLSEQGHKITIISHDEQEKEKLENVNSIAIYSLQNECVNQKKDTTNLHKDRQSFDSFVKNNLSIPLYFYYCGINVQKKIKIEKQINESIKTGILKTIINQKFDVIISSVYDLDAFYIAQQIKRILKIRYHICDVRDPLVHPFFGNKASRRIGINRVREIEKNVDSFLTVTELIKHEINKYCKSKKEIFVLPHAYKNLNNDYSNNQKTFIMALVGTYYPSNHDATQLLKAVKIMDEKKIITPQSFMIRIAGKNSSCLFHEFKSYGISKYIEDLGFVSREKAIEVQKMADALIFVSAIEEVSDHQGITGKFVEYLSMNKELLMIFNVKNNSSKQLEYFRKMSVGIVIDSTLQDAHQEVFTWLINKIQEKNIAGFISHNPNMEIVSQYSVDLVGKQLEQILYSLVYKC